MKSHHLQYPSDIIEMLKDATNGKLADEAKVRILVGKGFLELPSSRDMKVDENGMTLDFKITKFGKMILKENES